MRIRQVKPAFWSDSKMAELPHDVRLFYIGLWMLADDAGWLRWEPRQVAAELYPFESVKRREAHVERMSLGLIGMARLVINECGHARVPKMPGHQRVSSDKRVLTVEREHSRCSPREAAEAHDSPHVPLPERKGKGKVRNVKVAPADGTISYAVQEGRLVQLRDDEAGSGPH